MNFNEEFRIQDTFSQDNGYFTNASTPKQQPALLDLGFGSSDPFSKTRSRLNNSPLKTPLQGAINKVVNNLGREQSNSRISAGYTSQISVRNEPLQSQQDDQIILDRLHPQALQFLQKHFSGCSTTSMQIPTFIDKLLEQFSNLWNDSQAKAVLPQFVNKLSMRLGNGTVQLWRLQQLVRQNGIIGLILNIFKQLKSQQQNSKISQGQSQFYSNRQGESEWGSRISGPPEIMNLKNIIQQFTEGLAKSTENQIYSKLNGQMRKLVLKYNEAQNLLKLVNDRINENIDKINYGAKKNQLQKSYQNAITRLTDRVKLLQNDLQKQKSSKITLQNQNGKLISENKRLNDVVQKFQNHIIKTQEGDSIKQKSTIVRIPERSGIADSKSRIITHIPQIPIQSNFSKVIPFSPLRQTTQNPIAVSRVRTGQKQNNILLNTATIVRNVTPTKQRIVQPQVSPSRIVRLR